MDTIPPHASNSNLSLPIPATSGIYKITCIANNKIYIGSAINLRRRRKRHISELRHNKHDNTYMQHTWNKYGEQAFTFEVIEFILIPEMLTAREQYWFDKLKPFGRKGFNIDHVAGSPLGRKLSPTAKEKISQANRGRKHTSEARSAMGIANLGNKYRLGRKATPETLEKLRLSHLGKPSAMKGRPMSPEMREKLRNANLGKKRSPEAIEKTRQANAGKKRAFKPNTYRVEGDIAYIALAGGLETIVDTTDLEQVLTIHWHAQYHKKTDSYQARGTYQDKSIYLNRYLTGAKERERIDCLNNNTLDNRRSNLQIAQITDTYHNRKILPSKSGIRGVSISKQHVTGTLSYSFRCRGCKISKNFPYTDEGLEVARVFAEAHYAAMKGRDGS